jgi:hypothetical protein
VGAAEEKGGRDSLKTKEAKEPSDSSTYSEIYYIGPYKFVSVLCVN